METTNTRRYSIQCTACKGQAFTLHRFIEKSPRETWEDVEMTEVMCHSGVGWELEEFTMTCSACGSTKPEVHHTSIKERVRGEEKISGENSPHD